MRYTNLGRGGPRVSVIGLGFWQAGSRLWSSRNGSLRERVRKALETASSYGINFLDTAEVYGGGLSEEVLGETVEIVGREGFIVASKVAGYRVPGGSVIRGVEGINGRLGFKVDLIQLHWPPPYPWPICTPVRALEEAVARGLAGYYGLSNFSRRLLEKALECAKRIEPISNQVQYSLAYRTPELDLKPFMDERRLALIAWSPLAKGALAGLGKAVTPAQRGDRVFSEAIMGKELQDALESIATRYGATKAQIALAWLVAKNAIPIPGFRNPERVSEYARAGDIILGNGELEALDRASEKHLTMWGREYGELKIMRFIPAFIQRIAITLIGGI